MKRRKKNPPPRPDHPRLRGPRKNSTMHDAIQANTPGFMRFHGVIDRRAP
jgi:hypothetical protein